MNNNIKSSDAYKTIGEITKEFLMSTGYIKGAHRKTCPIFHKINKLNNGS